MDWQINFLQKKTYKNTICGVKTASKTLYRYTLSYGVKKLIKIIKKVVDNSVPGLVY